MLIAIALVLGVAAGLLLRPTDLQTVRWPWFAVAVVLALAGSVVLAYWWSDGWATFDVMVRDWNWVMFLIGLYRAAGVLFANFIVPWSSFRTRVKVGLAVLSGATIVGHLTYTVSDVLMFPEWQFQINHFVRGALFATIAVFIGLIINQWRRRLRRASIQAAV